MALRPQKLEQDGLAIPRDIEFTEAHGRLAGAQPENVSQRALDRGYDQCGSLGSGNHFMEVQIVDKVLDEQAARVMGLATNMVCVMIHSGSRGLGLSGVRRRAAEAAQRTAKVWYRTTRSPIGLCSGGER